jgi:glycine hydroxymethyltransferase
MNLSSFDQVLGVLERHERDARRVINMVPSENRMSALAKLPLLLDVYHRYFFNVAEAADDWAFRGSQDAACLETGFTLKLLREMTHAVYVNPRPLSGLSGMAMVLSALGGARGSTILSVSPDQGGHYATGALAGRLGFSSAFMTGPDAHTIDYGQVSAALLAHRPTIVYVDQSNCLFPLDVRTLVETTRRVAPETLIHVDCSHWMGLVLGGQFPNPLDLGADSFGGSTHKTFPGPQKAVVVTNRRDLWDRLAKAQFEMISSHHFAGTISLGLALLEFRECGGATYAATIVANAKRLGARLAQRGLHVVAAERGFSAGHQLWIRTAPGGIDAFEASDRLYGAGIRVNAFPELPAIPERVLRIGVNEATYHGLHGEDIDELGDIFADAVQGRRRSAALADRVAALRDRYHAPYSFHLTDSRLLMRVMRLVMDTIEPEAMALEELMRR